MRSRARHRVPAGLVAGLLTVVLAGCGQPTTEDYCAQLREDREQLSEMVSAGTPSALLDNLEVLQRLGRTSPSDLRDEWQTFLGAVEGLEAALDEAGVSPEDYSGGEPPPGTSRADRESVAAAADQVRSPEVVAAASGIEQQGRDVCKINLGL